jgi:hypothetical protein
MKKDNLIWWVIGGIGAYALYRYYQNKNKTIIEDSKVVDMVVNEEAKNYPTSLLSQYNIILPVDMVSKKVKAKGEELRAGRFALQAQRINDPLYI